MEKYSDNNDAAQRVITFKRARLFAEVRAVRVECAARTEDDLKVIS